jgi:hypothetical protein
LRGRFDGRAAIEAARNDFFMKLLGETSFGREVAGEGEVAELQIEIVLWLWRRAAVTARVVGNSVDGLGEFITERAKNLGLLSRGSVDEILLEQRLCARIDVREAGEEHRAFLFGVPVSNDVVDEEIDVGILCARSIGARDEEFGHGGNRGVLMWRENSQCRRFGEAGVDFTAGGEQGRRNSGKRPTDRDKFQQFAALQKHLPKKFEGIISGKRGVDDDYAKRACESWRGDAAG